MSQHDHDDDAFDAFLRGQGELAQALHRLPQPAAPATLSAAVLEHAELALAQPAPANDAQIPDAQPARARQHFLRRARLPLGVAASALLGFMLTTMWRAEQGATLPQVALAPAVKEGAPEVLKREPVVEATIVPTRSVPPPPTIPPPEVSVSMPKRPAPASGVGVAAKMKPAEIAAPAVSAPAVASVMPPAAAPAPAMAPVPAAPASIVALPSYGTEFSRSVDHRTSNAATAPLTIHSSTTAVALPMSQPTATASAPISIRLSSPKQEAQVPDERAKAWTALITELLRAGLNKDALEEWAQFRKVYPELPVEKSLSEQIIALQK